MSSICKIFILFAYSGLTFSMALLTSASKSFLDAGKTNTTVSLLLMRTIFLYN